MPSSGRFIGIDIGAETLKAVELVRTPEGLRWARRAVVEHHKEAARAVVALLADWSWSEVEGAAVAGRLGRLLSLQRVPQKQALATGYRFLCGEEAATVVSIGAHGFSVLEVRPNGAEVLRENSRCSQGTGNFLRQLVERFDLTIEQASELAAPIEKPAPLSGRCPVILKTDMTHLANKGEDRARILAGLFDAVCENVQVLLKPRISPPNVVLAGGVVRAPRVRENFRRFLARHEMTLAETPADEALFLEALGAASIAAGRPAWVPALDKLVAPPPEVKLETVPALTRSLGKVKRLVREKPVGADAGSGPVVLGFDIGSTGSKAVAIDLETRATAWEGYLRTNGDPVAAAQSLTRKFLEGAAGKRRVAALGATGSGREIVGSLLSVCFGGERVFILNEIAAHAEGALHHDRRVDTIFEIGGQDAKYIRLADGRVVDSAMNEACSAGTGSFIEEQGKRFSGIADIAEMGAEALAAGSGVSLGQHCSVFMAEIIDEAVAGGVAQRSIVAGIYDSIIQNYLNRVKGSRSVGQVIFCQGMPFAADALAAAVARQTGSEVVVPPNPGTIGALGIALLAAKELADTAARPEATDAAIDLRVFLTARVDKKETFVCNSTQGCGGAGNKCRIDRMFTAVADEKRRFTWGGGCSLYDKGTRRKKLPDLAPDPFRERRELVAALVERVTAPKGQPTVGLTDEFQLKGLFPFFATFIRELGFDLVVHPGGDRKALKRGIEEANIPFCAPMQLFHGLVSQLAAEAPDFLFLPMLRSIPRAGDEKYSTVCPIVQASPDLLRWDLAGTLRSTVVSPVIDVGQGNLESESFRAACDELAAELGAPPSRVERAYRLALGAQAGFGKRLHDAGARALAFCEAHGITPVVVLGREYTLHNDVLNSNVPAILREQGAIAIPVDCYRVDDEVPVFQSMFWGHGQRNLRAAHQLRRTPGLYSVFCSNYSCGPDSFSIHFFSYIMEGRPFAIIETDGHSGDAGTKTRIEAFLHCVREDQKAQAAAKAPNTFQKFELARETLVDVRKRGDIVLLPRMGVGAEALAAALRGQGFRAEALPQPDRESVRMGRRHTSGKECVPMGITLGSLLQRIERDRDTDEKFSFFMPTSTGPCRFGVYHLLHKIVLERLGWKDRVRVWSPSSENYFEGVPVGFAQVAFVGFVAADLLLEMLYDARPVEKERGAANALHARYSKELQDLLEEAGGSDLSAPAALWEAASGRLFGVHAFLERAARAFAALRTERELPTVLVVGEIYVRCDPFANDFIIDKLEERGIRARFAPFTEWLEYIEHLNRTTGQQLGFSDKVSGFVQRRVQAMLYATVAAIMGWPRRTTVEDSLYAASPYVRSALDAETLLTVGGPTHDHREGHIDGIVSAGPLECMPNKIAEAQFFHIAEREGLLSLTLALNGDPVDPEVVDNFAFEVHARFARRRTNEGVPDLRPKPPPPLQTSTRPPADEREEEETRRSG